MKDIYLDGAANTPIDPKVFKAMKPFLKKEFYGNASATHDYGVKALMAIEDSRRKMATAMSVSPSTVIFTSGATEGNNTAIKSLCLSELAKGDKKKNHIVCGETEHSSVLNACKEMERIGFEVTYVKPDDQGRVTDKDIKKTVKKSTFLICAMSVNNELGTANPVNEITAFARKHHIFTLVDCTQCISYGGKYMKLGELYPLADMMTFSSHKIYGPEGVGCLIANNEECLKIIKSFPLLSGGSQEHGARGGTYNVPGIVGMAKAVELMAENSVEEYYRDLLNYLLGKIYLHDMPITLNVNPDHKNILSLDLSQMIHTDSAASALTMLGVACSSGSACDAEHDETAGDFNPSHVLTGIDLTEESIRGTIRVSFTKYTKKKDIDKFINILNNIRED